MEKESKEGRENGGKNAIKEGENTRTADNEEAEKCGVERDTGNGVAPNGADGIKADSCQGPEAVPEAETTPEEPSGMVPSKSGSAQSTVEPGSQEDTLGIQTKADEEVKELDDEAGIATKDNNISEGKTGKTNASNSEKQSDPVCSQGIEEANGKTPDAPTAQNIIRDKMEDSISNRTQEPLPVSVDPEAGLDYDHESAPRENSGKAEEEESNKPHIAGSSSEAKDTKPETVEPEAGPEPNHEGATRGRSKTYEEEREEPQKTDSSSEPKETKPPKVLPGAGPEPHAEGVTRERSGKTGKEKEREPQKTDSKTEELKAGLTVEDDIKERSVSISVCTSAYDFNVQGLVSFLKDLKGHHPELINEVKVHTLPYNDLDHYKFPKETPVDVMLLCHSINNRRFAITDVMDALYDEYLPYCARVVGKNKMGVIVHDFDDIRPIVQSSRMGSFQYKQPKAFETTSLQITCGHIEEKEQVLKDMQKADQEKLLEFLKNASNFPAEMMEQGKESKGLFKKGKDLFDTYRQKASSSIRSWAGRSQDSTSEIGSRVDPGEAERNDHGVPGKGTPGGSHQTPQTSRVKLNQMPCTSSAPTSALQRSSPRHISISVCSSAYEDNVRGFMSKLTELQAGQPHMIADVRFRSLPYNDIDSYRFPSNDPVDVMVLCHSVHNRGYSITNVQNALYEKYLQYCHDVIGKKKLAVIVHDFRDFKPKTLDASMEAIKTRQHLTFELVDTVIVCGSLKVPGKIEVRDEDITRLTIFFEKATFQHK